MDRNVRPVADCCHEREHACFPACHQRRRRHLDSLLVRAAAHGPHLSRGSPPPDRRPMPPRHHPRLTASHRRRPDHPTTPAPTDHHGTFAGTAPIHSTPTTRHAALANSHPPAQHLDLQVAPAHTDFPHGDTPGSAHTLPPTARCQPDDTHAHPLPTSTSLNVAWTHLLAAQHPPDQATQIRPSTPPASRRLRAPPPHGTHQTGPRASSPARQPRHGARARLLSARLPRPAPAGQAARTPRPGAVHPGRCSRVSVSGAASLVDGSWGRLVPPRLGVGTDRAGDAAGRPAGHPARSTTRSGRRSGCSGGWCRREAFG